MRDKRMQIVHTSIDVQSVFVSDLGMQAGWPLTVLMNHLSAKA
jgi:hypothetical protein